MHEAQLNTRSYIRSSSFVMAMLFTVLCGLAALTLGYFINYFARGHFVQSTEAVLNSEIKLIDSVRDVSDIKPDPGRIYLRLGNGDLPPNFSKKISTLSEGIVILDDSNNGRRYAAKIHTAKNGSKILVGYDITSISHDFRFMQFIGIASIVFVIIVVFVSFLISIFVVNGTNKIAYTAREIMETGDLSRRIDIGSRWDDLGNMAEVLNLLLTRIEELMKGIKQVSDNIAHDLRTPLTRMRNRIEEFSSHSPGHADLLTEADRLLSTFNALLRISRLETEKQRGGFRDADIRTILEDVCAFYEPLAEEKRIRMTACLFPAVRSADPDLLFQAFANIVDNAIKFTPDGGEITIQMTADGEKIRIDFKDSGPGVAPDELMRIFERFYRAEKSRTTPGTGLGLSLSAAIIKLHHGAIYAENRIKGFSIITIL